MSYLSANLLTIGGRDADSVFRSPDGNDELGNDLATVTRNKGKIGFILSGTVTTNEGTICSVNDGTAPSGAICSVNAGTPPAGCDGGYEDVGNDCICSHHMCL